MRQPAVKWTGSKRSQASEIIKHFPKEIKTYYEPFCGGCSVLIELLHSDIKVDSYQISDINDDLISLWKAIKYNVDELIDGYDVNWNMMKSCETVSDKQLYYNSIRKRFNETRNSNDFLFLNRTCINGLIRYNRKGLFNSPYHLNRDGILPDTLSNILHYWSVKLNEFDVSIKHMDYREIVTEKGDMVYLDPPYFNTKGMYYGGIIYEDFLLKLASFNNYILSYDGYNDAKETEEINIPHELYNTKILLKSGNSSFTRMTTDNLKNTVYEALYIKGE